MNYAQSVLQANRGNKAGRVGGNKPRRARGHRGGERGDRDRRNARKNPNDKRRGNKNQYMDSTPRPAGARAHQRQLRGRAARHKQHMRNRGAGRALPTGLERGKPIAHPGTRSQPSTRLPKSDRVLLDDAGIRPTGVSMRPGSAMLETASAAELLPCPPLEELARALPRAWFHQGATRLDLDRSLTKVEDLLTVAAQEETAKHVGPSLLLGCVGQWVQQPTSQPNEARQKRNWPLQKGFNSRGFNSYHAYRACHPVLGLDPLEKRNGLVYCHSCC